jgi:hypothetical protein
MAGRFDSAACGGAAQQITGAYYSVPRNPATVRIAALPYYRWMWKVFR